MSRENPYTRLKKACEKWGRSVVYPKKTIMTRAKEVDKGIGYRFDDVYYRTQAAQSLGYEVIVTATEGDLIFTYREKPDRVPFELDL